MTVCTRLERLVEANVPHAQAAAEVVLQKRVGSITAQDTTAPGIIHLAVLECLSTYQVGAAAVSAGATHPAETGTAAATPAGLRDRGR
jgi:hypothetical protein